MLVSTLADAMAIPVGMAPGIGAGKIEVFQILEGSVAYVVKTGLVERLGVEVDWDESNVGEQWIDDPFQQLQLDFLGGRIGFVSLFASQNTGLIFSQQRRNFAKTCFLSHFAWRFTVIDPRAQVRV